MKALLSIGWSAALLLAGSRVCAQLPQQTLPPQQVVYQQHPAIIQPAVATPQQAAIPQQTVLTQQQAVQQPVAIQQQGVVAPQQTLPVVQQQPTAPYQTAVQPAMQQPVYTQGAPMQAVQPVTAQYTLTLAEGESVPQQTVIPEQQPPVQVSESTTYYVVSPEMSRTERRQLQQRDFAARIDSLIRSHNYFFRARTMQELPAGREQRIYADFYYCAIAADHVEMHLPVEQGTAHRVEVLNFDAMTPGDYRAARLQAGWNISFAISRNEALYHAEMIVSTATGEVQLTLIAPHATMRYTGGLQL